MPPKEQHINSYCSNNLGLMSGAGDKGQNDNGALCMHMELSGTAVFPQHLSAPAAQLNLPQLNPIKPCTEEERERDVTLGTLKS